MDLAREVGRLAGTVAVAFALLTLVAAHVSAQGENSPPVAVGDERGSVAEIQCLGPISIVGNGTIDAGHRYSIIFTTPSPPLFLYEPDPSYVGPDTFTYDVRDGMGGVGTGTVTVTVGDLAPGTGAA